MPIIYRAEKGSPLTVLEIDDNFRELNNRLKVLEDNPEAGEGLGKIEVQGDQMILTGSFGTDFGTFRLPKANLSLRGKWLPQTPYQKLDFITDETGLYCCLKEHTSTIWSQDHIMWQEILSFPKSSSCLFSLYEKATLPMEESIGKLAFLLDEEGLNPIFFNGKTWQRFMKGEIL